MDHLSLIYGSFDVKPSSSTQAVTQQKQPQPATETGTVLLQSGAVLNATTTA